MADTQAKGDLTKQFGAGQVSDAKADWNLLQTHLSEHNTATITDSKFVALIEDFANQGNLFAARVMARLTMGDDWGIDWSLDDVCPFINDSNALKWASIAVQSNHGEDFAILADCYLNGRGVERDPKRALELLLQAGAAYTLLEPNSECPLERRLGGDLAACISKLAGSLINGVTIQPAATPHLAVGNAPAQG